MRKILIPLLFVLPAAKSSGQTRVIEKLKHDISTAQTNAAQLNAIFALCDQGYTLLSDTLMAYAGRAKQLAMQNNDRHSMIRAMYYQSYALTNKALIDSSLNVANSCLDMLNAAKIADPVLEANLFNQKGRCYMRKNKYKEAIEMGYKVIGTAEKANDTLLQIKGKTLVGWAYLEMGQTREALNWHLKALETTSDTLIHQQYGILFANLALNYNGLGKTDSALYFINKAITYSRRSENLFYLSNSLAIQAQLFVRAGKAGLAEDPLKEVVAIRKLIGDPFYIVSDMSQLSLYYAHNGQAEKGIELCKEGIAIANEYKMGTKLFFLYGTLAENYKAIGDNIKYAEVLEKIIVLKDSIYQTNSAEALAEMQTKYELQKKENLIIRQQLDITRKNYLFYGLLGLSFFIAAIAWILFAGYKRKQRIKVLQMQEEEKRISEAAVKDAEENERKRIASDLHDSLGAYANAILYNTELLQHEEKPARRIELIKDLRFASKDIIISLRETIWALKKDHYSAEDCLLRMRNFVQPFQGYYQLINFRVEGEAPQAKTLHYSRALHLVRIAQEAFTNAIKHSGAHNITIYSASSGGKWKITVKDDGKGFDYDSMKQQKEGNGLQNMEQRARISGFALIIKSGDKGTEVIIEL